MTTFNLRTHDNFQVKTITGIKYRTKTLRRHLNNAKKSRFLIFFIELDPSITFITFLSVNPRVTFFWTGSVHMMTRIPVATVTAQFFTLHTVRVVVAFCDGTKIQTEQILTTKKFKKQTIGVMNIHAQVRSTLVICKIDQNFHCTNTLLEILKASH